MAVAERPHTIEEENMNGFSRAALAGLALLACAGAAAASASPTTSARSAALPHGGKVAAAIAITRGYGGFGLGGGAKVGVPHILPRLTLDPAVVLRGRTTSITVIGLQAPWLEVRAAGATVNFGQPLPWTALHLVRGAWHGLLPAPEFRGVYPLELRVRAGSPVMRSESWLLRVFARGTQARPSFSTPEGVAGWWVRTLPSPAKLVAVKRWPRPAFDRRDRRRHQLLVIAYSPSGQPAVRDRLGMFVTAVRDGLHASWRLLEATVAP
jgi:hypothetical protein